MKFPQLSTYNIEQQVVKLPQDFSDELNLVFIVYGSWHVWQFEGWLPFALRLQQAYRDFTFYSLSTAINVLEFGRNRARVARLDGMMPPIPDRSVLTTYTDKFELKRHLHIESDLNIVIMLVRQNGTLEWCETGSWSPEKADSLDSKLLTLTTLWDEYE